MSVDDPSEKDPPKRTLLSRVHHVRSVRGACGGLWRALKFGEGHAPLSTEGDVHPVLVYYSKNGLRRRLKLVIRSTFGSQETVESSEFQCILEYA
jgi:hypothetical protein